MKLCRLMFFLSTGLLTWCASTAQAQTPALVGEEAFSTEKGLKILDTIEAGHEFLAIDTEAFTSRILPRLRELSTLLPRTADELLRRFRRLGAPRWYLSTYRLRDVDPNVSTVLEVTYLNRFQVSVRRGDEVFVQEALWRTLPLDDQALLLTHHVLLSALGDGGTTDKGTELEQEKAALDIARRMSMRLMSKTSSEASSALLASELRALLARLVRPGIALDAALAADASDTERARTVSPTESTDPLQAWTAMCLAPRSLAQEQTVRAIAAAVLPRQDKDQAVQLDQSYCDEAFYAARRRRRLDLSGALLFDASPFRVFDNLTELSLPGNRFASLEPLGALRKLRAVDLSRCRIAHVSFLAPLSRLPELQSLTLARNHLQTLRGLSLPTVSKLDLAHNLLGTANEEFPEFPSLEALNLTGNEYQSLPAGRLSGSPSLKILELAHNRFSRLTDVALPDGVQVLDLSANSIRAIDARNGLFDRLLFLNLSANGAFSFHAQDALRSLRVLDVSGNMFLMFGATRALNAVVTLRTFDPKSVNPKETTSRLEEVTFDEALNNLSALSLSKVGLRTMTVRASLARATEVDLSDNPAAETFASATLAFPQARAVNLTGTSDAFARAVLASRQSPLTGGLSAAQDNRPVTGARHSQP